MLIAILVSPGDSDALDGNGNAVERQIIENLFDWIDKNTSYDLKRARVPPPKIDFVEVGTEIIYEGSPFAISKQVEAAYDRQTKTIWLVRPWAVSNRKSIGALLHELLHHVQAVNKDRPCWTIAEQEAYTFEKAWLVERGVSQHDTGINVPILPFCLPPALSENSPP